MHTDDAAPLDGLEALAYQSEGRFRQMVECAPTAMVVVNRQGEIELVNLETERLFGYARHELLGQPLELLVPTRHRGAHAGLRSAFLAEPQTRPMGIGRDLHGLRQDGTEFPVEIGLSRIETATGPVVLSSIIDISGRRALEEQLRRAVASLHQAEKMEALGRMTGGIAHDFNNLLMIIAGSIENVAASGELTSPRSLRALQRASLGAVRAARLTAQMLAFSRPQELAPSVVEPNRLVGALPETLSETVGSAIAIRVRLCEDPWPILVDASLLEDALLNLAINARDAMPNGGTLTIGTANVHLDAQALTNERVQPGDYGLLTIADTGCGMVEEVRGRAFEPFFTTKAAGHGTGLGLAQVQGFVTRSGGFVRLESTPGSGTVFMLYFPRAYCLRDATDEAA